MVCSHKQGKGGEQAKGNEPMQTFCERGGGVNFVRTFFMNGPEQWIVLQIWY